MIRERTKRSIVWTMSDADFTAIVKSSISVGDICRKLSGRKGGSIFNNIKRRIDSMGLNTIHFIDERCGTYSFTHVSKQEFIQRLDAKKLMDPGFIKRKLLEFSILKNECSECGLSNIWNKKPLVLVLDHIDGDFANNTISNFRLLCPNCNSQTSTFSMGKRVRKETFCIDCKVPISNRGIRCHKCGCIERERIKRMVVCKGVAPLSIPCRGIILADKLTNHIS